MLTKIIRAVLVLAILIAIAPLGAVATAAAEANANGTLWGKVTNPAGVPIANAYVVIEGSSRSAWTNAQGTFGIGNLTPGWYSVATNKPGYSTDRKAVQIQSGQTAWVDLKITPVGTLWGRVSVDGAAFPGAQVQVVGTTRLATTNSQGTFGFSNLPVGWYQVMASYTGYNSASQSVQVVAGQTAWAELTLQRPGGTLWGKVKNPATGAGLGSVTINGVGKSATSDAAGSFGIGGIVPGWYMLKGNKTGYVQAAQLVEIKNGQTSWADVWLWPQAVANDPYLATHQWGAAKLNLPQAWNYTRGTGVIVAVVDTGVDLSHPDLAGHIVPGYNAISPGASPQDDEGHGTHVAGIVAAMTGNAQGIVGTAWDARIMPVKVMDSTGHGSYSAIADGIRFAAAYGARVINLSLGGPASSSVLQSAVQYAQSKGVLVVAAAGNCNNPDCYTPQYPANYASVLGVAATDQSDTDAYFSSCGSWIDISAPGVDIWSTYWPHTYTFLDGTSMATPFVAGSAALIFSRNPSLSASSVSALLLNTARDLKTAGWDECTGYGLANPYAASVQAMALSSAEQSAMAADTVLPNGSPEIEARVAARQAAHPSPVKNVDQLAAPNTLKAEFRPGIIVVKPRSNMTATEWQTWLAQKNLQVERFIPDLNLYVLKTATGQEQLMLAQLANDSAVEFAEPDYLISLSDPVQQ
jgi:thermitase